MSKFIYFIFVSAILLSCNKKNKQADVFIKASDYSYHFDGHRFVFTIENTKGIHTNFVFDSTNLSKDQNKEFVRFYLIKDIHPDCFISYTFTTDTVYDWQTTNIFKLKIDSFYHKPNPSL